MRRYSRSVPVIRKPWCDAGLRWELFVRLLYLDSALLWDECFETLDFLAHSHGKLNESGNDCSRLDSTRGRAKSRNDRAAPGFTVLILVIAGLIAALAV